MTKSETMKRLSALTRAVALLPDDVDVLDARVSRVGGLGGHPGVQIAGMNAAMLEDVAKNVDVPVLASRVDDARRLFVFAKGVELFCYDEEDEG